MRGQSIAIDGRATVRELAAMAPRFYVATTTALIGAINAAEESARLTTQFHDQSGATRKTIKAIPQISGLVVRGIVTARKAARFLEFGTKGHGPVTSPYLRFQINGHWVSTKFVRGIAPRNFMQAARNVGQNYLATNLPRNINSALHGGLG